MGSDRNRCLHLNLGANTGFFDALEQLGWGVGHYCVFQ